MKKIFISDMTLCREGGFGFKEKIEIARQLDNLGVDIVELPEMVNLHTDTLFVKTVSAFIKKSVISLETGITKEGVRAAAAALAVAEHPRLRVTLPVSAVGMEYICHKKAPKLIELAGELVREAKKLVPDVEFCAADATRAEADCLYAAVRAAAEAGANTITVCDDEGRKLPDELGSFVAEFIKNAELPENITVGIRCGNENGLAAASSVLAIKAGASCIKTSVSGGVAPLDTVAGIIKNCGVSCGIECDMKFTVLGRILSQIAWIIGGEKGDKKLSKSSDENSLIHLDANDSKDDLNAAVRILGYDLSSEDENKVFEEFRRVAEKKNVGAKELDAIVASVALQVPPTYKLVSYVVNTGNVISASAQIMLDKNGEEIAGIGMGDGPIDASFRTIEQIVGRHFELDDFQIQSVTEGREAVGSAIIRLKSGGRLYSGNAVSTDIVCAGIRAYINALNKIVYEEGYDK